MQLPYRSPQPPKDEGAGQASAPSSPEKPYTVAGLRHKAHMPIHFQGQTYDLANLSEADLAYLRQFPDQVPYLQ